MGSKKSLFLSLSIACALVTPRAFACLPEPPRLCEPLIRPGAYLPMNTTALGIRHEQSSESSATLPKPFFRVRNANADVSEWSVVASVPSTHPYYWAQKQLAPTDGLGAQGPASIEVAACDSEGKGTGSFDTLNVTVGPAARAPIRVQPLGTETTFKVFEAPDKPINCGYSDARIVANVQMTMPDDVLPWLDLVQWRLSSEASEEGGVIFPSNWSSDTSGGIQFSFNHSCSNAPLRDTRYLHAFIAGQPNPAIGTFTVDVPSCNAVRLAASGQGATASMDGIAAGGGLACSTSAARASNAALVVAVMLWLTRRFRGAAARL